MDIRAQSAGLPELGDITRLLQEMHEGDPKAAEELLSHIYQQLRTLAAGKMAHQVPG